MWKPQQIGKAHNYPSSSKSYSTSHAVIGGREKGKLYAQRQNNFSERSHSNFMDGCL